MQDSIRWGILSTANIGRKRVIPAIQESSNGEVVAVASRSKDRVEVFAEELGIPKAYGSYEELIADEKIDAIYNPLPNHLHAEWSIKCAETGKPVLCEKPLAVNADEAQRMVDAFEENGVPLAEAFMYRFHPRYERVKKLLDEGTIGDVRLIRATFSFALWDEDNIRLKADMAGGALMDVGCYCVNVMRLLTGEEPASVTAQAVFGEQSGVDEVLAATMVFPSGVVGVMDTSLRVPRHQQVEIRGTGGQIILPDAFGPDAATVLRVWCDGDYREEMVDNVNQYRVMVEDFADALLSQRPPRFAPGDAVANMRVIDRLLAAARGSA